MGLGWITDTSLLPGEGGLLQNYSGEEFTVTCIGEVLQGNLTKPIPAGLSIRSSMVPEAGGITTCWALDRKTAWQPATSCIGTIIFGTVT